MNGTIGSVTMMGYGTPGSINLVVTMGYGIGSVADTVDGIPCLVAGSVYIPGGVAGAVYKLGFAEAQVVCDN